MSKQRGKGRKRVKGIGQDGGTGKRWEKAVEQLGLSQTSELRVEDPKPTPLKQTGPRHRRGDTL